MGAATEGVMGGGKSGGGQGIRNFLGNNSMKNEF